MLECNSALFCKVMCYKHMMMMCTDKVWIKYNCFKDKKVISKVPFFLLQK
uniref:Uncharacterized protein n=1 Tax=Arundo donax TaxID=35708 RepID=A0A0A8Z144_ARUDO